MTDLVPKKDWRRFRASEVELYVHYQKQLATLNRELARRLYCANKTRKTNSFASTPCVPLIISYLEISNYKGLFEWQATLPIPLPPPIDLLKRKALALINWQIDTVNFRGGYICIRVLPPSDAANNIGSALIRAADWGYANGGLFFGPWGSFPKDHVLACLRVYGDHNAVEEKAWDNADFGLDVGFGASRNRYATIGRVSSITFTSDRQESRVDIPGQIAPYGSCGEIPGVAHFYPHVNCCEGYHRIPFDELITIDPPTSLEWQKHRGKRKPSERLETKKQIELTKQMAAAPPPISNPSIECDYVALSSTRSVKRRKRN